MATYEVAWLHNNAINHPVRLQLGVKLGEQEGLSGVHVHLQPPTVEWLSGIQSCLARLLNFAGALHRMLQAEELRYDTLPGCGRCCTVPTTALVITQAVHCGICNRHRASPVWGWGT